MSAEPAISISTLSRDTGLTLRAIRFYEHKGLLKPERRGTSRLFSQECRRRAQRIVEFASYGFSLVEIKRMLEMTERETRALLAERFNQLEVELVALNHDLQRLRETIDRIDREWNA